MAVRFAPVVDWREVVERVVVALVDVVDCVRAFSPTEITNSFISFEDYQSPGRPVPRESGASTTPGPSWSLVILATPLPGGFILATGFEARSRS